MKPLKQGYVLGMLILSTPLAVAQTDEQQSANEQDGAVDVRVEISTQGDELRFSNDEIRVVAGQIVLLTFTNSASAASGLEHNWVLVEKSRMEEVSKLGVDAGSDPGSPLFEPYAIAVSDTIGPGEETTFAFEVPAAPGRYPFLCTVDEHWKTMRGVLVVQGLK